MIELSAVATAAGTVLVAVFGFAGAVYVAKAKAKTDIRQSIDKGFEVLTENLQEEQTRLIRVIADMQLEIDRLRANIERLFNEGDRLRLERRAAQRYADDLERLMKSAGLVVPEKRDIDHVP